MDEDILIGPLADDEAIAFEPVEPFDDRWFERAGGVEQVDRIDPAGGAVQRRLGIGTDRSRHIEVENRARLAATIALHDEADDRRAFRQGAAASLAHYREMHQDIAAAIIGHHEAIAPHGVEPFDNARYSDVGLNGRIHVFTPQYSLLGHAGPHATTKS